RDQPATLPDQPATETAAEALPWQEETGRDRTRQRGAMPSAPPTESAPEPKPRRDLLFSSLSRKDRAAARMPDPATSDLNLAMPAAPMNPPVSSQQVGPSTSFEDAWPPPEPFRPDPYRRGARRPSTFNTGAPAGTDDRS